MRGEVSKSLILNFCHARHSFGTSSPTARTRAKNYSGMGCVFVVMISVSMPIFIDVLRLSRLAIAYAPERVSILSRDRVGPLSQGCPRTVQRGPETFCSTDPYRISS